MSSNGQIPTAQVIGLGTAATYNVPASGNAAAGEVVLGSDSRLGVTGSGSGQGLKDFAFSRITSGNLAKNSATYVDVNNAADLVLTAAAGDIVEAVIGVSWTAGSSTFIVVDVVTVVSGSPVNSFTTGGAPSTTASAPSWGLGASTRGILTGPRMYTLQAGDISAGTVTLRLRVRCGSVTIAAGTDPDLYFQAKNLGPAL